MKEPLAAPPLARCVARLSSCPACAVRLELVFELAQIWLLVPAVALVLAAAVAERALFSLTTSEAPRGR